MDKKGLPGSSPNTWPDLQLYNLATHPGELYDLASEFPERAGALAEAWED